MSKELSPQELNRKMTPKEIEETVTAAVAALEKWDDAEVNRLVRFLPLEPSAARSGIYTDGIEYIKGFNLVLANEEYGENWLDSEASINSDHSGRSNDSDEEDEVDLAALVGEYVEQTILDDIVFGSLFEYTDEPDWARKAYEEYIASTGEFILTLKEEATKRSIPQLLNAERLILSKALKFSLEPTGRRSNLSALADLEDCQASYDILSQNPEGYKAIVLKTCGRKRMKDGLPLDAARQFFKSHSALFDIFLECSSSLGKDGLPLTLQRKSNLELMEECYIELQKKVLGLA